MMRVRFPLLLLLGVVFLASVSASFTSRHESLEDCLQTCEKEHNPYQKQVCQVSCSLLDRDDEEEHGKQPRPHPQPQPHREEGDEDEREQPSPRPHNHPGKKDKEHEEDEREQQQPRPHKPHQESEDQQQGDEEEDSESESPRQGKNPFHFSSDRFQTLFRNQYGQIRLLQRFDKRSRKLQNLEDYRILEFRSKPRTLLLPHHDDAEFLLFVQSGRAIITFVNPDNRDSYNLESGDAIRIPAGTTFYVVNPQENENLRIIKLALPVNNPRRIQSFFLSSTEEQQSYLEGFSNDILEASLDTGYEEIHRVLFGDKNRGQKRQELEGVFVEISEEQIRELRRNAKSSSRKTLSSEDEPFNLRSNKPVHSNNFGKFFEITPEKNPQLKDLDISLGYLDISEGGLLLPNYQSKSTLILAVDNGEAEIELVGLRKSQEKQQQEEQQGPREVRRYRAELSQDDIVVVPAGYPFAIKATSNVRLLAFGINAENNQRNFLAGEKDNLLRQLHRLVKDLAFPGSAEEFEKLIQNQRESYFADAQSQQGQEERRGKKGPLSSILGALY